VQVVFLGVGLAVDSTVGNGDGAQMINKLLSASLLASMDACQ